MSADTAAAPPPRPGPLEAGTPRYLQVARTLLAEIEAGRFPVGTQLPTEFELCAQFGISRATAREAVKRLVQLGLVVRQPRVGSTVTSTASVPGYRQLTADVADLLQYASDTTLTLGAPETPELDDATAELLEAAPGARWLRLEGLRHGGAQPLPICHTALWIAPAFRAVQGMQGPQREPVYSAIERQFNEAVVVVEQEIRAVGVPRPLAVPLGVKTGSPALWVCRKYRNRHGQLIEVAISTHPAGRFSYTSILRREWATQR